MSYKSAKIGRVFLLRWRDPRSTDIENVLRELRELKAALGAPPVYIGVVPEDSPAPSPEARKAMMDNMRAISDLCETVHVVMLGRGLRFTAQRSAAAAMFLIAGTRKIYTDDTLEAALKHTSLTPAERTILLDEARKNEIVAA